MEKFNLESIDLETLGKGDEITASELETIIGLKSTEYEYNLRLLSLREFIEIYFSSMRGMVITLYHDPQGNLQILEDAEAYNILKKRLRASENRLRRDANRFYGLDRKRLTASQQRQWEQDAALIASKIGAINEFNKQSYKTQTRKRDDIRDQNSDQSDDE